MFCPLLLLAIAAAKPGEPKSWATCLGKQCAWWWSDRCVVQLIAWRLGNLVEVTAGNKQNGT